MESESERFLPPAPVRDMPPAVDWPRLPDDGTAPSQWDDNGSYNDTLRTGMKLG